MPLGGTCLPGSVCFVRTVQGSAAATGASASFVGSND